VYIRYLLFRTELVVGSQLSLQKFLVCHYSISSMRHYKCVALRKDISLLRGQFCARSLASYIRDPAKTGHLECSSSRLCAAAPVVASNSLEEVQRWLG